MHPTQPTKPSTHLPKTSSKRDALNEFLRKEYPRSCQHIQTHSVDGSWSNEHYSDKGVTTIKAISVLMTDLLRILTNNNVGIAKSVLNKLCIDFMKEIENSSECYYTKCTSVRKTKQTKAAVCLNAAAQSEVADAYTVANCDTDSTDNYEKDQMSATVYEPQCICGMRTSVSEVIVSNIRTFLEPLKTKQINTCASNARDAIITACTSGMSSNMNEVRKILGINKGTFYKRGRKRIDRMSEYETPTRKKRKSKHGDIQRECVLEFCHPDDSSSTDTINRQTIIMNRKRHQLPVWSEKSINQQYQMFIHSETVDRYKELHHDFLLPSKSFYYRSRCPCLSHPVIEKSEKNLAHTTCEDAIENNSVNSEDMMNFPILM